MNEFLAHYAGSGQSVRLVWDFVVIGLALYELAVKRKNGIILGLFVFALGDMVNAFYSVFDSVVLVIGLREFSATLNPNIRLGIIGTGTWIGVIGRLLIVYYLWVKPK